MDKPATGCCTMHPDRRTVLLGGGALALAAADTGRTLAAPLRAMPLIDVHHHVFPDFYLAKGAGEVASRSRGFTAALDWTPEKSIADMDAAGTTMAVLSMVAPIAFDDPGQTRELASRTNGYCRDLMRRHVGRFGYFAVTPLPDIDGAIAEIGRELDRGTASGVGLLTSYDGKYLGDDRFEPVLAELDRRHAVAYVHPFNAACCVNLTPDLPPAFIETPFEATRAIASLLYAGRFHRYPNIRWIFSHGGGTLPFLADRLSQWGRVNPKMAERVPDGALTELKRLHYDTASVTNAPAMAALGKFVSWSQVMFGTDFPFVSAVPQLAELRQAVPAEQDFAAIAHTNATRLLNLRTD